MMVRADSTPARCPATRGRCRRCAQRPLPSMITAICRGRRPASSRSSRRASSRLAGSSNFGGCTLISDVAAESPASTTPGIGRGLLCNAKLTYCSSPRNHATTSVMLISPHCVSYANWTCVLIRSVSGNRWGMRGSSPRTARAPASGSVQMRDESGWAQPSLRAAGPTRFQDYNPPVAAEG
jgi:hypothetical protein